MIRIIKNILVAITFCVSSLSIVAQDNNFYDQLSDATIDLTRYKVKYDPSYFSIPYPNGDLPADKGVCTDVVIRAYRKMNIDLQRKVHEDMKSNFSKYPSKKRWGLTKTDTNIDHRRVYNLEVFFTRNGIVKPITKDPNDYKPGDIVSWTLDNGLAHIGIVIDRKSKDKKRNLVVHNIGGGQVMEDVLFAWKIVGHYQYK